MTKTSKEVQLQNVANRQNGVALPVLDPKLEGYEVSKVYQWKMCLQLSAGGMSSDTPVAEISNKTKHFCVQAPLPGPHL
eukprot:12793959-Ditylum_brightwellii.AAC.1